jgi:quercetin dioxygenase-like cupin family protein/DNA-binding XRE family transcriptional regulator
MPAEPLAPSLESYQIGPRIHVLRKGKNLSLVKLGEHTGMSAGLLSKIERGRLIPTLPTLLRIAMVFGVGLEHFFAETDARPAVSVVRRADRLRLAEPPGAQPPAYFFESLDFTATDRKMSAYLAEFPPRTAASPPHSHPGAEFLYVLRGSLALTVDDAELTLDEGDSAYFDPGAAHSYRAHGSAPCAVIVVVAA